MFLSDETENFSTLRDSSIIRWNKPTTAWSSNGPSFLLSIILMISLSLVGSYIANPSSFFISPNSIANWALSLSSFKRSASIESIAFLISSHSVLCFRVQLDYYGLLFVHWWNFILSCNYCSFNLDRNISWVDFNIIIEPIPDSFTAAIIHWNSGYHCVRNLFQSPGIYI